MHALIVLLACSSDASVHESAEESPYAAVIFDARGMPDCVESVSDEAFCEGWASQAFVSGTGWVRYPDGLTHRFDDGTDTGVAFSCATSSEEALAALEAEGAGGHDAAVDVSDPRWFIVRHAPSLPSVTVDRLLVPRCGYFAELPEWTNADSSGLAWAVAELPPNKLLFWDQSALYASLEDTTDNLYTHYWIFAHGVTVDTDAWRIRFCELDDSPAEQSNDGYIHRIYQQEFTMDPATGRVEHSRLGVRDVECEASIGVVNPWRF